MSPAKGLSRAPGIIRTKARNETINGIPGHQRYYSVYIHNRFRCTKEEAVNNFRAMSYTAFYNEVLLVNHFLLLISRNDIIYHLILWLTLKDEEKAEEE